MTRRAAAVLLPAWLISLCVAGCGDSGVPEIVPVSGVVTLRGKPLPKVMVVFTPTLQISAEYIAVAETDDQGKFELIRGDELGACACEHIVTIREGMVPPEMLTLEKQAELLRYRRSLKNRPIPKQYKSLASTPLKVTVTPDQTEYDLVLE